MHLVRTCAHVSQRQIPDTFHRCHFARQLYMDNPPMRGRIYAFRALFSPRTFVYLLPAAVNASHSSLSETFIVVLLLTNLLTVILLPVMSVSPVCSPTIQADNLNRLLLRFRSWLDAVRMLTLLTCHIGMFCEAHPPRRR